MKIVRIMSVKHYGLFLYKEKKISGLSSRACIFKEYFVCKFPRSYLNNSKTSNKLINSTGRVLLRGRCKFEKAKNPIVSIYVHVRKDVEKLIIFVIQVGIVTIKYVYPRQRITFTESKY